jgi:hypothetical protein
MGVTVHPFVILGALGLLSFAHDAIPWRHDLLGWLDAWRMVTHTVTQFLFGWIPPLLHLPFPGWAQDYLAMGLICAASWFMASVQAYLTSAHILKSGIDLYFARFMFPICFLVTVVLLWPAAILVYLLDRQRLVQYDKSIDHRYVCYAYSEFYMWTEPARQRWESYELNLNNSLKNRPLMFFASSVLAALIVAINYALQFVR